MATDFQKLIEQEKDDAKQICSINGEGSAQCAAAWDAVEEVQAAASHATTKPAKNSLAQYCDENPDAAECRLYED